MKTHEGDSMGVEDLDGEENAISFVGLILKFQIDRRKSSEDC
jgi:hypothetical protein